MLKEFTLEQANDLIKRIAKQLKKKRVPAQEARRPSQAIKFLQLENPAQQLDKSSQPAKSVLSLQLEK